MKDFEMRWRDPESEMPPNGVPVIAAVVNEYGYARRIRVQHVNQHTVKIDPDCDDGDFGEYDEASDAFYWPEGWYETNEYEETHWKVMDYVHSWMPLPPLPPGLATVEEHQ